MFMYIYIGCCKGLWERELSGMGVGLWLVHCKEFWWGGKHMDDFNDLGQNCSNSIANTLELLESLH